MAVDKDASVAGGVVSNSQGSDGQNNDDLKNGMIKKFENKKFFFILASSKPTAENVY